jgi:hypothetical protein
MPFWSQSFGEDAELKDPKRAFRFTVSITGIAAANGGPLLWYANSVSKPTFTLSSAEHKYLNHTFYYPGMVTWNSIDLKLVDPGGDPDVAATLAGILEGAGYKIPSDASSNSLSTISKARATGALGRVEIKQINADGKPIETWTLWNAFVEEVDFGGTLSYGDEKLTEIGLKLKYDWARIETETAGAAVVLPDNKFFNV